MLRLVLLTHRPPILLPASGRPLTLPSPPPQLEGYRRISRRLRIFSGADSTTTLDTTGAGRGEFCSASVTTTFLGKGRARCPQRAVVGIFDLVSTARWGQRALPQPNRSGFRLQRRITWLVNSNRCVIKYLICVFFTAFTTCGQGLINVGNHFLLPDMAGQLIPIFVTGGDPVQGLNFNAQIGDGGIAGGGTNSGPSISAVFLLEGTIFASNNTGQQDPGSFPQLAIRTVSTGSGVVLATGLLARVVIDTTGWQQGTWPFALKNTLNGPTDFAGRPATITDGTITIIPEPEPFALVLSGWMLWVMRFIMAPGAARRRA